MLELRGVHYQPATASRPVLDQLDLELPLGCVGLVAGASGSGKTTMLEVIGGLAEADAGSVLWSGEPLNARQRRWLCGLVFQFPERHFLGLSVGQELRLGLRRLPGELLRQTLDLVGLADLSLQQPPEQLSGGQQRRLALAVQLLRDPRVLLLDEPTAGLDWTVRREVLDLLRAVARERAVLVVSHEPELFEGLASRRWLLRDGRLQAGAPYDAAIVKGAC